MKLYLFGASGHSKVIVDILLSSGRSIQTIYDDNPKVETILGIPVLKSNSDFFKKPKQCIISIGRNKTREMLSVKLNADFVTAIHPASLISAYSEIGNGTVVMGHATINPGVRIGEHCIINTNASVDHDCVIDDFAHISPNVALAGNVTIGKGSHVGIGASVIQGVSVGKWVTIGAGAVIIENIPDYATVVGNPGRIIKENGYNNL